jgi:ketosteroid isomerase-like protein
LRKARRRKTPQKTPKKSPAELVARRFVERINAHDLDGIVTLLTADHRFVDSLGTAFDGREMLYKGWSAYLRMVPDYRIDIERAFVAGNDVLLVGTAAGTYSRDGTIHPHDAWTTPGAWLARIRGRLVAEWRVYADNEPIRRRMREVRE